jgi:hypothetical protein
MTRLFKVNFNIAKICSSAKHCGKFFTSAKESLVVWLIPLTGKGGVRGGEGGGQERAILTPCH